jgi:peptidoglycan/xylan/chitin deacetylase (PgdA/CDA1 family)
MKIRSKLRSAIRRIWPPKPRPLILVYHRIANEPIDNWGLAVSPAHFEEQLQVVRRTRHPFPLTDFVRNLKAGTLPSNAVAVTFDDGYVDNLVAGKPRLAAADVPATVFLATGFLDRSGEFWWDELASLVLSGNGPRNIELVIAGETMQVDLGTEPPVSEDDGAMLAARFPKRHAALAQIRQAIWLLEKDERELVMTRLRSIFTVRGSRTVKGRAMTKEEVRTLVSDGLITVGAHTVTHPVLSSLDAAACRREITESKLACEALIGKPVAGFAYPYGNIDTKARGTVVAAGFSFACAMKNAPVTAQSDVFALPRVYVLNWSGDVFEQARHRHSILD